MHTENDPQHERNNVESAIEDNATEEEDIPQRQEERQLPPRQKKES